MQRVEFSFIEGNLWQLRDRKDDEPSGGIRVQWKSGLHNRVVIEVVEPEPTAGQVAHKDKERLVLGNSLMGLVPESLENETIACRQRGQGIEPGGPAAIVEVLLVEHKYRAHLVQNS